MPLNLLLNPTSTGEVFASTYDAIEKGITPKTLLPSSHNFREFWTDHLRALSQPGIYDTVIDALVALTQGDPSWRSNTNVKGIVARRGEMRQLFQQHPPDIVVVSGMDGLGYGFHHRNSSFWQFIHISEVYINLWKDAERSSEKGLALTVLIASAIDHEIGHWIYTLVSFYYLSYYQFNVTNYSIESWVFFTRTLRVGSRPQRQHPS
jgi:hypothetical protein